MKRLDYLLIFSIFCLLGIGLLILSGVSAVFSWRQFGTTSYFFNKQLIAIIGGLIFGFIIYKTPINFLKKLALPAFLGSLFLMFLTIIPNIGVQIGGARRWLNLGFVIFQPAELLKLTFIFYLGTWLSNKKEKTLLPFLAMLFLISLALYLQRDLSTFFIVVFIALVMYFIARKSLLENIGIWAGIILVVFFFLQTSYRLERIFSFFNLNNDPLGSGFQGIQALITVGSGGFLGRGLGFSSQKMLLPHSMSDSIFAIIAEEGGFLFSFLVLFFFFVLFWKCFSLAKQIKNKGNQLIIIGIGTWFLIQTLIHVCAMIGYLPVTGVPLPLISYGGSHIFVELMAIGLMFGILKYSKK